MPVATEREKISAGDTAGPRLTEHFPHHRMHLHQLLFGDLLVELVGDGDGQQEAGAGDPPDVG